jgi:hypothetical protein
VWSLEHGRHLDALVKQHRPYQFLRRKSMPFRHQHHPKE